MRLVDRSRIVADWVCPRKRYWNYEFNGRGVVKNSINQPLHTGSILHDSLAAIATYYKEGQEVDIDLVAFTAAGQMRKTLEEAMEGEANASDYANEQAALVEGMLRGYYKYTWPKLIAMYPKIVAIEQECECLLSDDITFMSKPDLLLESADGEWHYIEYKSTSSKKTEWIESWNTAVQLHSSVKAVEETMGKAPIDVTVLGLYKGYNSYGKQSSPFCYAYMKRGTPPFTEDIVAYEYKAGLRRYPTWELEGGTKKWVEEMPDEILSGLYPMTPPIYINEDLVINFFEQVVEREGEIARAKDAIEDDINDGVELTPALNYFFPQRFDQCRPAYGFECEYRKLCHGNCSSPINEGYMNRTPHHAAEMEEQGVE